MNLLQDKVIIVTGATSGLGEATALEGAKQGAKVVLAARRVERGEALVEKIKADGGEATFIPTDVTQESDIENLINKTIDLYGRLDGAFNNAGTIAPLTPLTDLSTQDYQQILDTNLRSTFWSIKYEVPAMQQSGGGAIVNCSSINAKMASPGIGSYALSKLGIVGLSRTAAVEYAPLGIRVNTVLPGVINTEIWEALPGGYQIMEAFGKGCPLGRHGEATEVAQPVIFLLSNWASYMTGAELVIDGGFVIT